MSSVVAINQMSEAHNEKHQLVKVDPWREATPENRELALKREQFLAPFMTLINKGVSQRNAITNVLTHIEVGHYGKQYIDTAKALGRKSKLPGRSTIAGWIKAYRNQGKAGLLDQYTGRVRQAKGWEAIACRLYNIPSKPSYAAVARKLKEDHGFEDASEAAVRRYLKSLPADMGENSPQRMGRKLYNNSQRHFIARTTENIPVGALYQGDGHTLDVYLAHPVTGDIWRAELTVWMDIRSRYIAAWYISNAESSIDTIRCIAQALMKHNHVPPLLYVDNGCGYASRMMADEVTGFYQRLDIECIFALPGNAKAKGQVERWFRTMERDLNVWFGDAFCGEGMADEISTKFVNDCKRGKKQPPSLEEWCSKFEDWLDKYHNRAHPEFKTTTPAELWQQLEPNPVNMDVLELLRPHKECKVQRGSVRLDNRWYRHEVLTQFNKQTVIVEYDLQSDERVTVRSKKGELICDATLVKKKDYLPSSRIEEAKQKATKAAVARLEKKVEEKKARAGLLLDHSDTLEQLDQAGEVEVQHSHVIEQEQSNQTTFEVDLSDAAEPEESRIEIDLIDEDL
ncbi:MAG: Mu transposase C-terminal domain-containing protein [Neptuniibacter sp.]